MSVFYSIRILLDLKYKENHIEYLFQKCIENNMRLYKDAFENICELDSSDSTARILAIELEPEERRVYVKFQDTDFSIAVYKEKTNLLKFSISGFGIMWRKEFINDHYDIDFARYIRLLLRVCRSFTILELKTGAF